MPPSLSACVYCRWHILPFSSLRPKALDFSYGRLLCRLRWRLVRRVSRRACCQKKLASLDATMLYSRRFSRLLLAYYAGRRWWGIFRLLLSSSFCVWVCTQFWNSMYVTSEVVGWHRRTRSFWGRASLLKLYRLCTYIAFALRSEDCQCGLSWGPVSSEDGYVICGEYVAG